MSSLWRTGRLVLAMLAVANQLAFAEEAAAPAAEPAAAPPAGPAPAEPAPAAAVVPADDGPLLGIAVHGYLKSEYRGRWTSDASDHDLYETLSLDLGDSETDRVTAHFLGDVAIDLDGNTDNTGYYAFDSVRDSTGSGVAPLVYSAYVDIHRVGALGILRLGRQSIYETPEVAFFDGLRLESRELGGNRLKLGAYGGVPVYLYEGNSSGDLLGGAYAESHLWQGARARLDWLHLEGSNGAEEYQNDLMGADAWQSLGEYLDLHGHFSTLDEEARDILARATFSQPDWDFLLEGSYFELMQMQQDAVIQADAYYPVLGDYLPYLDCRVLASKGFGEVVNIDLGVDIRRLTHNGQESSFNHEFDRYYATLDVFDVLGKGSSISLTGEQWVSGDEGTETSSQGLDITYPFNERSTLSGGTAHYLYKYDDFAGSERDDVQTWYLKFEHKHNRTWRFSVDYEFEDDSSSTNYNELRCEVICSF